jgi:hypothetical protein
VWFLVLKHRHIILEFLSSGFLWITVVQGFLGPFQAEIFTLQVPADVSTENNLSVFVVAYISCKHINMD